MIPSPRVRVLGWLLAASLPLAAASAQNRHTLRSVTVLSGGHPVREAASAAGRPRILYSTTAAGPALAASIGTTLELEITVGSEVPAAEPRVACAWQIMGAPPPDPSCRETGPGRPLRGESVFRGWQGGLPIPVPGTTGIYDLILECRIRDRALEKIRRRLFVTWAEPLAVVLTPERAWYEKACCWGGGFTADAMEADILKAMLRGIRGYGRRHWRYGYATRREPGVYLFTGPDNQPHVIRTDQVASCYGGSYCKCPWQALVATGSACNFADCYVFSDTLQHIAATLGVGGLLSCYDCTVMGEEGVGFFTSPNASSLDPRFPRDVLCGDDAHCPAYFFSSHSLLWRNHIFFDSTFNKTYPLATDPVWESAGMEANGDLFIGDKLTFTRDDDVHYGDWDFFKKESPELAIPEGSVKFTNNVTFRKVDVNGGGIAEALEVDVEIKVLRNGRYTVRGHLRKGAAVIATRPYWWTPFSTKFLSVGKKGEVVTATLRFSGDEIYLAQEDGPWEVVVYCSRQHEGPRFRTPPYRHGEFGERSAWMGEPAIAWMGSKESAMLRVEVPLAVREPDTFLVQLHLAQGGRTIANAGGTCAGFCPQPLVLEAPVRGAAESGLPYLLSLGLFQGADPRSIIGTWREVPARSP